MIVYKLSLIFYSEDKEKLIPIDYQDKIKSYVYNHILKGDNKVHNDTSLYSVSRLHGKSQLIYDNDKNPIGLHFDGPVFLNIRTIDLDLYIKMIQNVSQSLNSEISDGYKLVIYKRLEPYKISNDKISTYATPTFMGALNEEDRHHITPLTDDDKTINERLTKTFLYKANKANLNFSENDISFKFINNKRLKNKLIKLNGAGLVTTQGTIEISGNPDAITFLYGVGIGRSSGCGFGYLNEV